jgi:PAS domain-containing protein
MDSHMKDHWRNRQFNESPGNNHHKYPFFNLPLETINFGVWIWYSSKRQLFLSRSFSAMMGMPEHTSPTLELLAEHIHPDDLDRFFSVLKTMVDGDWPADFTFRVCLPDESIRTIRCIVGKMDDECGEGYDVIGVCYQLQ